MEYVGLELDLSGLSDEGTCYLLSSKEAGLAPLLDEAGIPFVLLGADPSHITKNVKACVGEGTSGWTNLDTLPDKWTFSKSSALHLNNLKFSIEKSEDLETEERFAYGEVLIPDWTDAHGHTIGETLVRRTSHNYMAKFQRVGFQHNSDISDKVSILESYIAPVDFELAGSLIRKGTWMMGVRVNDAELWGKIKAGDLTGFSIGGWGKIETL